VISMVATEGPACSDSLYLSVNSITFTVRYTVQHMLLSVIYDNDSCQIMPHTGLFKPP
jgi:hypothetical protein